MKIFYTPSAQHLAPLIGTPGNYTLRMFNDGEFFVRLDEDIAGQHVGVVTATNAPARHMIQLLFLLDALYQQQAKITLVFTYFGYQRQDHPKPMVARAAAVVSNCFKQFTFERVFIVHPHSARLQNYLEFQSIMPFNVYIPFIKQLSPDVIIAPDQGATSACMYLAQQAGIAYGFIQKERQQASAVQVCQVHAEVAQKDVLLFDDIVSTAHTITQVAIVLRENGARRIHALVTHNLLNARSAQRIEASPLENLWVSNTLAPVHAYARVQVLDISSCIAKLFV